MDAALTLEPDYAPPEPSRPTRAAPTSQSTTPPRWRRVLRLISVVIARFTWIGVAGTAVLLAFAFTYPQDLRETSRPLMVLNCVAFAGQVMHFHLGLACLAAAGLGIVLLRWRLLAAALVVGLPALVPAMLSCLPKSPPPPAGETVRVASFNILYTNYSRRRIFPELERLDADVICFQEWHHWHEKNVTPVLSEGYPHQLRYAHGSVWGMAIFSRRPFLETTPPGDYRGGEQQMRLQRVVIEHEGRPLAIYNIHPKSPGRPGALVWSQRQTAELIDTLSAEPLPCVVAGDFNAATLTSNLEAIEAMGFTEAHALAGRGRGATWPNRTRLRRLPGIRIDHIYLPPELTATRAEVGRYHGSDHLSVIADIAWRRGGG